MTKLTDKEARALTDQELADAISAVEPKTKERDANGYITADAGKAIAVMVPLVSEQQRRQREREKQEMNDRMREILERREADRKDLKTLIELMPYKL